MLEIVVKSRKRHWEWSVQDQSGVALLSGRAHSRIAARYEAERALFELLRSAAIGR
jgi:hypothetical protein